MAEYHSLIAVFCTAEIPPNVSLFLNSNILANLSKTIKLFLERVEEDQQSWYPSPRIMSKEDLANASAIISATTSLPSSFISPFLGKSVAEINGIFVKHFASQDPFLPRAFIVIDKRTTTEDVEQASCQLVHGGEEFDEKDVENFVRVDFYLSMQMAMSMEQGMLDLDEHDPEKVMGVHNMSNY